MAFNLAEIEFPPDWPHPPVTIELLRHQRKDFLEHSAKDDGAF
jgi:hypothetical protein